MPKTDNTTKAALKKRLDNAISQLSNAEINDRAAAKALTLTENLRALLLRPIKVALGGEFSSGKSTLTKMMLGQHVVTIQASANTMPTVCFRYGRDPGYRLITGNDTVMINNLDDLSADDKRSADCLEVMLDLPFLQTFEVYDTPGTSDPTRDTDQLLVVAEQVDFMIWCTNATQAWRESERQMWASIPEELKEQSLLIVTHVDLPNVKASIDRLMARITREAGPLFGTIIPMDLISAVDARSEKGDVTDPDAWNESGGAKFQDVLDTIANVIQSDIFHTIQDALDHDIQLAIDPSSEVPDKIPEITFQEFWKQAVQVIENTVDKSEPAPQHYIDMLDKCLDYLSEHGRSAVEGKSEISARLKEASEFLADSSQGLQKTDNPIAIIRQLDWEFEHLADIS